MYHCYCRHQQKYPRTQVTVTCPLTMALRQELAVYGWVRENYDATFLDDIINIIFSFYRLVLDTQILNQQEQELFLKLLFDTLTKQEMNKNMRSINTELLFRASEHKFDCNKFHENCHNKGATITIIHNEHDHIFGGYTSKSWQWKGNSVNNTWNWYGDSNAFLFMVRPKCKLFGLRANLSDRDKKMVIHICDDNGPIFGNGWDIYIGDDI